MPGFRRAQCGPREGHIGHLRLAPPERVISDALRDASEVVDASESPDV
jgi:hypothetical protein